MQTFKEKRTEERKRPDRYYSVEISISDYSMSYQFKIWDISTRGLCLLVRQDSKLLDHLEVGDVLKMKYYGHDNTVPAEHLNTRIAHITKCDNGTFKGHFLVGLSILGNGTE